jgi:phage protein D
MASTYKLLLDGTPADDNFYTKLASLEVEENADLPGAIQLELPVTTDGSGDLTFVTDSTFQPFANLAVVATPDGSAAQCIFDGYVLSHKLHLETGVVNAKLQVWGQDASWLMNLEEKTREWVDVTDADVASSIFGDYGISPASDNSNDDSPSHTEDGHSLMQRGSDIQFLRRLARANGKLCRVACADQPGVRTGFFSRPSLDGDPVVTLTLNDPTTWNVDKLDFEWDLTGPTSVQARQAVFDSSDEDGVSGDATSSGLTLLDQRDAATFAGRDRTVMLTTPVDSAGELLMRAQALLTESGWFVRCEGEADVSRLHAVLRAGDVVQIDGIGSLNSGKYMVWSVRHTIGQDSHKMKFVLVRNALGPPPSGGGGLLGALP